MRIDFHVQVPNRVIYTHRLIRKARRQGALLTVVGDRDLLHMLDVHLWTWEQGEFLPHANEEAPEAVQQRSPILLRERIRGNEPPDVLINLSSELPLEYKRWARLIDIVSNQEDDLRAARQRWWQLVADGHQPTKFENNSAS
jgi:DNA polymerase-3 subunit chi